MSPAPPYDDEIRLLLSCGSEAEIQQGFALIDQHLRSPIFSWLRTTYFSGLTPEDFADLWQGTLLELLEKVRAGTYDGGRKVFSDLCRIIYTNRIDEKRRHKTREKLLHAIGTALANTQVGQKWKSSDPAERKELQRLIREAAAAATISDKQRVVLEQFIGNLPESWDMQELRRFVSEHTGIEQTLASVKSSLKEVRRKLRQVLMRKGYGYNQAGDDDE